MTLQDKLKRHQREIKKALKRDTFMQKAKAIRETHQKLLDSLTKEELIELRGKMGEKCLKSYKIL